MSKYQRELKGQHVDVYDVLKAFNVSCPALQHLIKKALCCGLRGHKDQSQDLQDIVDSAIRAQELAGGKPMRHGHAKGAPPPPPKNRLIPEGTYKPCRRPELRESRGIVYRVNDTWADGWNR